MSLTISDNPTYTFEFDASKWVSDGGTCEQGEVTMPDDVPDPTLRTADLHAAYIWDCDECGSENWQRSITIFLDPADDADRDVAEKLYGEGEPDEIVRAQSYPSRVICKHCKTEFIASQYEDNDDA